MFATKKSLALVLGLTLSASAAVDYAKLHDLAIRFYGYQRAGTKNGDPHNPFYARAPYPHSGDAHSGKDLSGGWYDAGDFVKFGLPLGYAVYCLLKGYDAFPRGYQDKDSWDYKGSPDGIPDILGEVKVATDYLQKAVISDNVIVMDVGNGIQDHNQWIDGYANSERVSRQIYTANGADVPGLYAASLALMSILYKEHDAAYAQACLNKAKLAFTFGLKNKKVSSIQNKDHGGEPFYSTSTWADKMMSAAIELYRATKEDFYMEWAKQFLALTKQHFFVLGYANVGDLGAFEMARQGVDGAATAWLSDVNLTISRKVTANNAPNLIRGAFINSDWGNAGHAAAAGFSAALAYITTGSSLYKDFAISQVNWVAGESISNQSYVVGYGSNSPSNVHHRNNDLLGKKLKGGVVSGPTPNGNFNASKPEETSWSFSDSKDVYKNTEVALDYNAGLIGAVAFIRDYNNPPEGTIRIAESLRAMVNPLDLNKDVQTITMKLEKSTSWKIVLTGASSGAKKTQSGSSSSINFTWKGESDEGSFQAGEKVVVEFQNDNVPDYHKQLTATNFTLGSFKREAFRSDDVLVDDFEDGDIEGKQGASWESFSDALDGGSSYTSPRTLGASAITSGAGDESKGLRVRLVGQSGHARPHAGIRIGLTAMGKPVSLGNAKSIVFDITPTSQGQLRVELEQPGLNGDEHFGSAVELTTTALIRVRVPISGMKRPDWVSGSANLNTGNITGLRFTYFGTGNIAFTLDNVHIEGLNLGQAPLAYRILGSGHEVIHDLDVTDKGIRYQFLHPAAATQEWAAEIFDFTGAVRHRKRIGFDSAPVDGSVSLEVGSLGPGIYFLRHTSVDGKSSYLARFVLP